MTIRDVISQMTGRRNAAPETAAIQITPGISFAMYLIALGVGEALKDNAKAEVRCEDLATKMWNKIDTASLKRLGFPITGLGQVVPWSKLATNAARYREVIKEEYTNNPDVPAEESKFMHFAGMFFQNPTKPNYLKRALVQVTTIGPAYASLFSKTIYGKTNHDTGSVLQEQIKGLVQKATGKSGTKLSTERIELLKKKSPDTVKQYNRLRTDMRKQMLVDFSAFIEDKNDGKPVQVSRANDFLYDMGYDEPLFPELPEKAPLFVGVDGGKPSYYTSDGRRLIGGIPSNAVNIIFMKTYDKATGKGGYVSYRTPEAKGETPTKLYTAEHKNAASDKKFSAAADVSTNMSTFVARWKKDLASQDEDKFMSATAAILIYLTGMRVGSSVSARSVTGKATTGAITLKVSNVKLTGDTLTVKYIGKKGMAQNHTLKLDKTVPVGFKAAIKELLMGKGPSEYVFSVDDAKGRPRKLPYTAFNAYLKATGFTTGIHKIRHARGTALMLEKLETVKFKIPSTATTLAKKQKVAEDFVKEKILAPVAHLLGHKKATGEPLWTTSIQNYCNPAPLSQWFVGQGLRVPKWIPKKLEA